jgi:hypothetical protein
MPYYIKNIRKPNGRTYPMWYEQWWNPAKRKPQSRYVAPASGFGAGRLFAGAVGFVVNALKGEVAWHNFEEQIRINRLHEKKQEQLKQEEEARLKSKIEVRYPSLDFTAWGQDWFKFGHAAYPGGIKAALESSQRQAQSYYAAAELPGTNHNEMLNKAAAQDAETMILSATIKDTPAYGPTTIDDEDELPSNMLLSAWDKQALGLPMDAWEECYASNCEGCYPPKDVVKDYIQENLTDKPEIITGEFMLHHREEINEFWLQNESTRERISRITDMSRAYYADRSAAETLASIEAREAAKASEEAAEARYMSLREENQDQINAYTATIELQNERDQKGNEDYLAEQATADAAAPSVGTTDTPAADTSPEADADVPDPQGGQSGGASEGEASEL